MSPPPSRRFYSRWSVHNGCTIPPAPPPSLGLLGAVQLVQLPVALYGGMLADRFDRKKLMALTQFANAVVICNIDTAGGRSSPPAVEYLRRFRHCRHVRHARRLSQPGFAAQGDAPRPADACGHHAQRVRASVSSHQPHPVLAGLCPPGGNRGFRCHRRYLPFRRVFTVTHQGPGKAGGNGASERLEIVEAGSRFCVAAPAAARPLPPGRGGYHSQLLPAAFPDVRPPAFRSRGRRHRTADHRQCPGGYPRRFRCIFHRPVWQKGPAQPDRNFNVCCLPDCLRLQPELPAGTGNRRRPGHDGYPEHDDALDNSAAHHSGPAAGTGVFHRQFCRDGGQQFRTNRGGDVYPPPSAPGRRW